MPKFSDEQVERIIKRFNEVAPKARCQLCLTDVFGLMAGVVPLQLQSVYPNIFSRVKGDSEMPCVALVCKTCGNTILINLSQLGGLDDLIDMSPIEGW